MKSAIYTFFKMRGSKMGICLPTKHCENYIVNIMKLCMRFQHFMGENENKYSYICQFLLTLPKIFFP